MIRIKLGVCSKESSLPSSPSSILMHEYMFVYQEWDVMRERSHVPEERLEKMSNAPVRTNTFSMQLQEARIKQRLTLADLAEKCGVPSRQMSMYENGAETPSPEVYKIIASVLGLE